VSQCHIVGIKGNMREMQKDSICYSVQYHLENYCFALVDRRLIMIQVSHMSGQWNSVLVY